MIGDLCCGNNKSLLLSLQPTGMHVVCIDADSTNINNNVQPNDHRCLAILAILCACFPLGIVAIWQSLEVSGTYAMRCMWVGLRGKCGLESCPPIGSGLQSLCSLGNGGGGGGGTKYITYGTVCAKNVSGHFCDFLGPLNI